MDPANVFRRARCRPRRRPSRRRRPRRRPPRRRRCPRLHPRRCPRRYRLALLRAYRLEARLCAQRSSLEPSERAKEARARRFVCSPRSSWSPIRSSTRLRPDRVRRRSRSRRSRTTSTRRISRMAGQFSAFVNQMSTYLIPTQRCEVWESTPSDPRECVDRE
jgi:hypothetical protein